MSNKARWTKIKFEIKIYINLEELNTPRPSSDVRVHNCFSNKISRMMPIFSLKNPSYFKQWKRSLEKTRATGGNRINIQHNELEIDKILQFQ